MTNQKKTRCERCRKCLPQGKLNSFVHCYECPAAEYDERRDQCWCYEHGGWKIVQMAVSVVPLAKT